ncbi:MAG TPA: CPBP family intramembrane glutamic endopeptidase, partial [bacterium]|nr:CPBP family intramembrane glutamic endopeptidase [bacterium]
TLGLLTAVKIGFGDAFWRPEPVTLLNLFFKLFYIMGAALLIGLIEEFFFRGIVFQTFIRRFSWSVPGSVIATSIFYSLIHFISHKKPFVGPEPTWIDSLRLVAAPFKSLVNWPEFWPAAVGLFIFGIILNGLVIWTKSLYPAMGLHAGCVFFIKADGLFVDFSDVSNKIIFASNKMYDGMLGWVFLAAMGYLLWRIFQKRAVSK